MTPHANFALEIILLSLFTLLIIVYLGAAIYTSRHKNMRKWQLSKCILFILGIILLMISAIGPIARQAHMNFEAHMFVHLLMGMLSPLLLVLSAPMTLLLRTLSVKEARFVTKILKSRYVSIISHPIIATLLNIGGLWILYTTSLFELMHHSLLLHVIIHLHVFLAGYLFTASMIYIDPTPHRYSYLFRTIVFIIALAGHGILSKYIYANPPAAVPVEQAQRGAMLMYYGGDFIDVILIILLFKQWYKVSKPKVDIKTKQAPA